MLAKKTSKAETKLISGGGQIGDLLRSSDWSNTSLGPMSDWPKSLCTAINICLNAQFPMLVCWGKDLTNIYNAAFASLLAGKHPVSFGANGMYILPDLWTKLKPQFQSILTEGESISSANELVLINRNGYAEECYFTFSHSPLFDDNGHINGVFTVATETTDTIINARHLDTFNRLALKISDKKNISDIYKGTLELMYKNTLDFPFAMLYQVAEDGNTASLFGCSGIQLPHSSVPETIQLSPNGKLGSRNFLKCFETNQAVSVHDTRDRLGDMPSGSWNSPPEENLIFPISYPGKKHPYAILVIGINPHLRLNEKYKTFFQLLVDQIATEISNLLALQEQEKIEAKTKENDITIQTYIDELIRSQKKTEESEERFKAMANNAPVMIWTAGTDKLCDFYNRAWLHFTGRNLEQELNWGWVENIHPDDISNYIDNYHQAFDARLPFNKEYRIRRHDGVYRWVVCESMPRYAPDGTFLGFIGSCHDIHDRKMAKEELEHMVDTRTAELYGRNKELQQQKDFVETMLDASIDIMIVYDRDMRFRSFNKTCEKIYGLDRSEVLGKKLLDIYPYAAGSKGYLDLQKALAGETIHNPKYRSPVSQLYYEDFLIPLRTEDGEVYSVLVIAHDITGNIESAEKLKKTNQDLIKSNRDLEQFAYIASHDLQEPLRKIQTFSNLLDHHMDDETARKKYLEKIATSAQRMSDLIKAVLNYSRLNSVKEQFETCDLNEVISLIKTDFELMLSEKNAIITHDSLPVVKGILLQLNQLFSNLLSNALKFSEKDPVVHISARLYPGGNLELYPHLDPSQNYVEIIFKDNGIGFEQQYVEQVFTIFHRLNGKELYEGTGIGLALCKKIVDNHHGYIHAKSEVGKGTEFSIYLPA